MTKYYRLYAGRVAATTEKSEAQIIVLTSPDQEEMLNIIKEYQLDEHTFISTFDADELARVESEDEHFAIICKCPKNYTAHAQFQFRISSFGIFLFNNLVIVTTDSHHLPLADEKRFSRINSLKMFALKLINHSIIHFNEHLRVVNKMSDEFEQRLVYKTIRGEYLSAFGLSKSLVYYINAIASNGTLLQKLQITQSLGLSEIEREFLDDIIIENTQCRRQAEIYSNILLSMMTAHENIVSNDLNTMLKVLNVITIGIMVPTFVVSAASMNVNYPIDMESGWAFWAIMLVMVLSTIAFILMQKKLKW